VEKVESVMKKVNAEIKLKSGRIGSKLLVLLTMLSLSGLSHAQLSGSIFESLPANPQQSASGISNEGLNLLLDQVRQLQMEVQQLRALSDEQGYELRKMQRESLDRYTNIDSRLSGLEIGQPVGIGSPSAIPGNNSSYPPLPGPISGQPDAFDSPASQSQPPISSANRSAANTDIGSSAGVANRSGLQPAILSEQQMYQMAYDSVINSDFERSVAEFDQYLGSYPGGRFVANAYYWKGQAYLYLSRYAEARDAYQTIINQYPGSTKLPDAMYGLGQAYEGLGDIPQAKSLLTDIIRRYPNTGVANLADTRLMSLD